MIAETLKAIGVMTPDEWKVPKGNLAFAVKAYNSQGEYTEFFAATAVTAPGDLRKIVFDYEPDTTNYTFSRVSPGLVRSVGRSVTFNTAIRNYTGAILHPESIQLELKKDS